MFRVLRAGRKDRRKRERGGTAPGGRGAGGGEGSEVTEEHRMLFVENRVDLVVRVPAQPLWVMGDRARLTQILGNLLHNANKFTDSDGKVTVDLSESGHDQSAVLTIRDTGIGMEPEMLVRAFEPFVQAVDSVQRSRGGLGLGLALVRGFVELHGGNLSASS